MHGYASEGGMELTIYFDFSPASYFLSRSPQTSRRLFVLAARNPSFAESTPTTLHMSANSSILRLSSKVIWWLAVGIYLLSYRRSLCSSLSIYRAIVVKRAFARAGLPADFPLIYSLTPEQDKLYIYATVVYWNPIVGCLGDDGGIGCRGA
jgi:hypothetical protein